MANTSNPLIFSGVVPSEINNIPVGNRGVQIKLQDVLADAISELSGNVERAGGYRYPAALPHARLGWARGNYDGQITGRFRTSAE